MKNIKFIKEIKIKESQFRNSLKLVDDKYLVWYDEKFTKYDIEFNNMDYIIINKLTKGLCYEIYFHKNYLNYFVLCWENNKYYINIISNLIPLKKHRLNDEPKFIKVIENDLHIIYNKKIHSILISISN